MKKSLIAAAALVMLTMPAYSAEDGGGAGGGKAIADRHGGQKDVAWTPLGRVTVAQEHKRSKHSATGKSGPGSAAGKN